ncbi:MULTISPECIES: DUF1775 domain-containing protein [unclassified Streptomyces]|uniref:DUF1775 domain-containing protein n=1 Tax=unclassified Streptomyces TaxID=2593676 RepID=UPI001BAF15BB|nr:DUF1775 domain-containing protein [Streptomyces sp. V17-9]
MSPYRTVRTVRRMALLGATALAAAIALAGPAAAHAEVEADKAQALAEDVTLTFVSEAESGTAGFTALRVVLPQGIAPADVTLGEAPKGWKLQPTKDGYTVGGPALKAGIDAEHEIKVRQLPDARELAFKTVETYSDGEVSRWIELPNGGEEPEQPAPLLTLKPAAPGATPIVPSPSTSPTQSPTPSAATSPSSGSSPQAAQEAADEAAGSSTGLIIGGIILALLVLGGGTWWLLKRRASSTDR